MDKALLVYFAKIDQPNNFFKIDKIDDLDEDIKNQFEKGNYLVRRTTHINFEKILKFDLPKELKDYINIFWHPCIRGYYMLPECIVLFPVLKKKDDSDADILYYENGLISMERDWRKYDQEKRFIPIGWLGYSGGYILYEMRTGQIYFEDMNANVEGSIVNEPLANSLKELIERMNPILK